MCTHPAASTDAEVPAHGLSGMGGPGTRVSPRGHDLVPGLWGAKRASSFCTRSAPGLEAVATAEWRGCGGDGPRPAVCSAFFLCAAGSRLLRPAAYGEVAHASSLRSQPRHCALLSAGDEKQKGCLTLGGKLAEAVGALKTQA